MERKLLHKRSDLISAVVAENAITSYSRHLTVSRPPPQPRVALTIQERVGILTDQIGPQANTFRSVELEQRERGTSHR